MLKLTEPAREKLSEALASGELASGKLRVFICCAPSKACD